MTQGCWYEHNKVLVTLFLTALFLRLLILWVVPPLHLSSNARIAYLGGARLIRKGRA